MDQELLIPEDWERMFSSLFLSSAPEAGSSVKSIEAKNSRIAVFGGNRVGKSTFNRWLINKFLESVESEQIKDVSSIVYIDLDPGQAEFTPPGVVSVLHISEPVHGSNHTHLSIPTMSKFLGNLNVSDCAGIYVRSCKELLDYMNSQPRFQNLPWIINTMGFSRGLGVTLACELISLFTPNVVVQIGLKGVKGEEKRSFPFHLSQSEVSRYLQRVRPHVDGVGPGFLKDYQFFHIDSVLSSFPNPVRKSIWNVNARELRDRVMMSYFALATQNTDDNKITSVVPRLVSLDDVTLATMQSALSYEEILLAMNGNLVALCFIHAPEISHSSNRFLVKADRFPNEFIGYGIVRAIDRVKKLLYIVTPVPEELLMDQVNCIVTAGNIGLPLDLYLHGLNQAEDGRLPYVEHKSQASSKLNESASRRFVPNRVAHSALKTCLL